jgi:molybdopterin converting factor subunit 1
MQVKVVYFAALREQRGLSEETVETSATTAGALYDELRARHALRLQPDQLRAAINDAFVTWDAPLSAGDTVVFIPPVAGG